MDVVEVWNSLYLYWLYYNSRAIWSLVYQPGYLSYPGYRIFTGGVSTWVSSFLSASNVFLIAIRSAWASAHWPLGSTFPVLFRLEWFFIYSDQFLQTAFYISPEIPENWSIICWRLLLNGLRLVLVNATDKPLRLKNLIVSNRVLVPRDRMTCIIAFRLIFLVTKRVSSTTKLFTNFSLSLGFDVLVLSVSSYVYKLALNVINTPVSITF